MVTALADGSALVLPDDSLHGLKQLRVDDRLVAAGVLNAVPAHDARVELIGSRTRGAWTGSGTMWATERRRPSWRMGPSPPSHRCIAQPPERAFWRIPFIVSLPRLAE
jgi:hypothetical protein